MNLFTPSVCVCVREDCERMYETRRGSCVTVFAHGRGSVRIIGAECLCVCGMKLVVYCTVKISLDNLFFIWQSGMANVYLTRFRCIIVIATNYIYLRSCQIKLIALMKNISRVY